jgi:hypothetical protein
MSRIRDGYNFPNVSVNYRYGLEESSPIPDFSQPINQRQISFSLLGKANAGVTFGATRVVAEPLFEEFDEIVSINEGVYANNDTSQFRFVQTTKILRLTGLNVINVGDNYTTAAPIELTFNNANNPFIFGDGEIYDQPILDITTINNGGLGSFSILDSGRFKGSYEVEGYTGESIYFSKVGTGFFGEELDEPDDGWDYNSGTVVGTGALRYDEFKNGVYQGLKVESGNFSGFVTVGDLGDQFVGTFTSPSGSTKVLLETRFDDEFALNSTGSYFDTGLLILTTGGAEPTYTVQSSNPGGGFVNQDDIRDGVNYSNWNSLTEDPVDRQAYTHIVRNPNVDSVSPIFDIKRLNDTLHVAEKDYKVTDKPNWYGGGDLEVDLVFRIGNPTDSFVTMRLEWGFLNVADSVEIIQTTYNGQTAGGYLVQGPTLNFDSWRSLQQSDPEYSNLTIAQLKSRFPKYVRISKDMFEQSSSLIERTVVLDSINEQFNTTYSYPSSALVATKINSTNFDNIPTRTYDAKLKKVWVPETYNIKHLIEDKRFRKDNILYGESETLFYDPNVVFNKHSRRQTPGGRYNKNFGQSLAILDKSLFVSDSAWGRESYNHGRESGQIFIYKNMAQGMDHNNDNSFQMIRDGIPECGTLRGMAEGPDFDIVSNYGGTYNNSSSVNSNSRVVFTTVIGLVGLIRISTGYGGFPTSCTHSLFLRVSPRKSAILTCSINSTLPNSGNYRNLMTFASGIIIGSVRDPNQLLPDQVLRVVDYNGIRVEDEGTTIVNNSDTDYVWIKFFSAQVRQITKRRIVMTYGIVEYAFLGPPLANPSYSTQAVHPTNMSIQSVRLSDQTLKNIDFDSDSQILDAQDSLLAHKARERLGTSNTSSKNGVAIFEMSDNGFWYPLQFIHHETHDRSDLYDRIDQLSFFPNQKRFAAHWSGSKEINIYKVGDSGLFELEDTFPFFEGIFEGFKVSAASVSAKTYIQAAGPNKIVLAVSTAVGAAPGFGNNFHTDFNRSAVYVYKKDLVNGWRLDEIVLAPDYALEIYGAAGMPPRIKIDGDWLMMAGLNYDGNNFRYFDGADTGVIILFRYNGKKYEFIKQFQSDILKQVDADGQPKDVYSKINSEARFFAEYANLKLDENNEPVVVTTSTDEETTDPNTHGHIYVFKRRPHTNEWVTEKYNPFNDFELNTQQNFENIAFDGKNVAVAIDRHLSLPNRVGTFSIKQFQKSTRVLETKNWFGVMKKAWSDNPAWIIYDLLTNPIYGAGTVLDDFKDINVFNFFEVAKYFDSIDDDGFYLPIYDERGRTEPRLSCNFLLENDFNAFEVISSICDMFFGAVYIKDGKYNIWADMPKEPSWYFNNYDVMDGNFSYSDAPKSSRASVIKVPYLDKYEAFKEKVEFIEDEDLIRKNGKNEAKLDFTTFTTRSQARRFGKHYLYNKSYETEKIKFLTDGKALFLNPGDVIGINDELKSFKNQKAFYEVSEIEHTEKVYAVSNTVSGAFTTAKSFIFSEITFNQSNTNDFEVTNTVEANPRNDTLIHYDLCLDNDGVPHVLTQGNSVCDVFKKTDDGFDKVFLDQGVSSYQTTDTEFESNLAFDIYNYPYLSIVENSRYNDSSIPLALTFSKLTGNDFTNSGHWQFTRLDNLYNDPAETAAESNQQNKSIIRINSNNDKYILTFVNSEPVEDQKTGEYLLYHCPGGSDDTNPSLWSRHVVAAEDTQYTNEQIRRFDMRLTSDGKPAFIYTQSVEDSYGSRWQIRYKELTGTNVGLESDWADVFVQGTNQRDSQIRLKLDKFDVPYVLHQYEVIGNKPNNFIIYPISYTGRFFRENWSEGTNFIKKVGNNSVEKMSLEFLQNGNTLIFSNTYHDDSVPGSYPFESLQFEESSDKKEWSQHHNWRKQFVYKQDYVADYYQRGYTPSTAYSFLKNSITLKNHDSFLYNDTFNIDTSIENNLEITNLFPGDVSELYKETQFKNFSSKIKEEANTASNYLTVTGFETSGNYINLFIKKDIENSKSIKELFVNNPMVRPLAPTGDGYKEYRVLNILEKEQNLYEVEAKEYFSDKFDAIDTFSSMIEPEEPEFNIGLPNNEVIRPPEPSGVGFITGLDDAGSPFLTGMITGEPNGSETEYRLSLLYPNGRVLEKEIEKNTNTLSSLNEPLTNFGFYNLAAVGNYELNVKSLRNPESSTFINKEFVISKTKDKVSTYPFINDIDLLVNQDLLNVKIRTRNVYGDNLNLFDSNCRINLIIEGKTYVENSKMTDFEISFQQIKELANSSSREREIKAQLTYNGTVISEKSKILKDEAPKITNVNFVSDGLTAGIVAEVEESEKLISIDMITGENTIKTFAIENQSRLQTFRLQDFEISKLPKEQKIDFNFVPRDFYGTGQALNCEGFIPEKESLFQKYNNSIIGIYSIYSEDVISNDFSSYESSNNQSGFYGNGQDCLVEFSSSLLSGQSASLNLELVSNTKSSAISIKFQNEGFLSSKKIMNLSEEYHNVRVSGESGLFEGFDLKIKKLV